MNGFTTRDGQREKDSREEHKILRRVYGIDEFPDESITHEKGSPDFFIGSSRPGGFCVEVTKFHIDERASGAYHNDKKYRDKILSDPCHIKSGHKKKLIPVQVGYANTYVGNFIYRPSATIEYRLSQLSAVIKRKEKKSYVTQLPIDLIVYDVENELFGGDVGKIIFEHVKRATHLIRETKFRKVVLCKKFAIDINDMIILERSE